MTAQPLLTDYSSYAELEAHARRLADTSIEDLFAQDNTRAQSFTLSAAGLHLDFSKQRLDAQALGALQNLATEAQLPQHSAALQEGALVNNTEQRPALHTLLRAATDSNAAMAQPERYAAVCEARQAMQTLVNALHSGQHTGYSGETITDVVNIGIGGSDLGPRLVTEALEPFHQRIRCHYVANVDPADLEGTLKHLDAERTLFIICSKSFRTEETLANGLAARRWLLDYGVGLENLSKHLVAVSSNLQAATEFGIALPNCLPMWDWVGGRYSVWSAVGLSCAIAIGWDNFEHFLLGAQRLDQHCLEAPVPLNMPIMLALFDIWQNNCQDARNHVVLPYDHSLRRLPDFLQQLTMESNGKRVNRDGKPLHYNTGNILWGSAGTIGQHSFHQLLHQGTLESSIDFILPLTTHASDQKQHTKLVANCLAQSRALMVGRPLADCEASLQSRGMDALDAQVLAEHLVIPGNRPHNMITLESLTPESLGALLALYEHRTYLCGQLWGVNPFDQWGVELGKEIGAEILQKLSGDAAAPAMDTATERLVAEYQAINKA